MQVFYYLAIYPEYLQALREEIEKAVDSDGWTKAGLDKMHKINSFINFYQ